MSNIIFLIAKETSFKLLKICEIAKLLIEKKEPLLILVPDTAALHFVSDLLWRHPEEAFLPHPTSLLSIATEALEDGHNLFNLRPTAYTEKFLFKTIYEFEDYTSSERLQLSKVRYQSYRDLGLAISLI
jgi:DNA polymerase IIIc chi subunit